LDADDFRVITEKGAVPAIEPPKGESAIVSVNQFALEAHLEEFMDQNWKHVNFGADLSKYEADEQSGRQFPAGEWNIDFLCTDKSNGDLVVVELKRGKTSDAVVGQVLRYIGWVAENIAKPGQRVRGIIISRETDNGLKYAVRGLQNVAVLVYEVDFKLRPANV
jgi:restriction system protein